MTSEARQDGICRSFRASAPGDAPYPEGERQRRLEALLPAFIFMYTHAMDAYERALKLLSMREHTEKEIRSKLSAKGYAADDVDDAVSRLIAEGSLSERRFAETFVRSRLRRSPEGRSILRMRLREKGSPAEAADAALSEAWERGDHLKPLAALCHDLVRKKGEEGARAALLRKGFRESEIREALSLLDGDIGEGE